MQLGFVCVKCGECVECVKNNSSYSHIKLITHNCWAKIFLLPKSWNKTHYQSSNTAVLWLFKHAPECLSQCWERKSSMVARVKGRKETLHFFP